MHVGFLSCCCLSMWRQNRLEKYLRRMALHVRSITINSIHSNHTTWRESRHVPLCRGNMASC